MKQPFFKPGQSLFWDNDINPEGLALSFNRGIWFGTRVQLLAQRNLRRREHA